jgi:very-short-patch-repair endonuclease
MSIASSRPSSQVADCFPAREIRLIGGASGVGKMRREPTFTEGLVWDRLRRCKAFRFRRQALAFGYILDFWCPAAGICVEIDGLMVHDVARDEERDTKLAASGISTLRLSNTEIMQDIDRCLVTIITTAGRLRTQVISSSIRSTRRTLNFSSTV